MKVGACYAEDLDTWSGVLMIAAMAILLLPILAVPLIFGGLRAKRLKAKVYPELIKVDFPPLHSLFYPLMLPCNQ